MLLHSRNLNNLQETATEMYRLADAWQNDMAGHATLSLPQLFDLLKNIPYQPDPPDEEFLQRPVYTLLRAGKGGDCDDKAIAAGAWAHLNGIPFRFVAVSNSLDKEVHHVYTEFHIRGQWFPFDPTYSFNVLGRPMGNFPVRLVLER